MYQTSPGGMQYNKMNTGNWEYGSPTYSLNAPGNLDWKSTDCGILASGSVKCILMTIPLAISIGQFFFMPPTPSAKGLAIGVTVTVLQTALVSSLCFCCCRYQENRGLSMGLMMVSAVGSFIISAVGLIPNCVNS